MNNVAIKKCLSLLFYNSKYYALKLSKIKQKLPILMYHRVLPKKPDSCLVEPGMYVTKEAFETQLKFLKKNYDVISLESIFDFKRVGVQYKNKAKCVITFDDGWVDFYKYAYPLLRKYKIPATVFLPTSYIGTNRTFWTDQLTIILFQYWLIRDSNFKSFKHPILKIFDRLNGTVRQRVDRLIELLKRNNLSDINSIIDDLQRQLELSFRLERSFINWTEVKEMNNSGLINFGSHTTKHEILTNLRGVDINLELNKSKEKLLNEGIVKKGFISFCYPNGNFNDSIAETVKVAGYHLAVTTEKGLNDSKSDVFTLKRVGIHQDVALTVPMFALRIVDAL